MNNKIAMIPGPVQVPNFVLEELAYDHGFGQYEEDFLPLYHETGKLLAQCMGTKQQAVIMTGEGMLALWAGLKSCLRAKDRVLSIATGIFGEGIGQMAASLGCDVKTISYPFNATVGDLTEIEAAIADFKPYMITAVHCETPSGTLNPLDGIGALKKQYGVPLFYVDAVSSLGGTPVLMDEWNIDLLLGGSQKCFSCPPNLSFLGVSQDAWEIINTLKYQGYDALMPWQNIQENACCPYTPYWNGVAALNASIKHLLNEGLENVFARHDAIASSCRQGLIDLGIKLWPDEKAIPAPTVTTAHIPQGFTWKTWQKTLLDNGITVGCGFAALDGKIFRLGHMGSQANVKLLEKVLNIIAKVI